MNEIRSDALAAEDSVPSERLTELLTQAFPDTRFASLNFERIGEAYGFASQIFRCKWQSAGQQRSVVAKLWSTKNKAGITEILFYESFQDIGIRIPGYFYNSIDEKNHTATLILEDLQDVLQGGFQGQLGLERARNVARSLGKLHGRWLDHPELSQLSWLPAVTEWNQDDAWLSSRKTEFLQRFDSHLSGFPLQLLNRIEQAKTASNVRLKNAQATLIHDDFHLDNILFEHKIEPVFLDWTNPLKAPGAYNLADLLFFMSPLENFDPVFDCYLDEFNRYAGMEQKEQNLILELGGALLPRFSRCTCGQARWKADTARGTQLQLECIDLASRVVTFWKTRDPELFSFVG